MKKPFNHENLKVYQDALQFAAKAESWVSAWENKHAICDHLPRAAGSVAENIAMASAAYSGMKLKSLQYALGSTLECAACLDIAGIKRLLGAEDVAQHKTDLLLLGTSHESAVKMAAKLDLCVVQKILPADEVDRCKRLLSRVAAMTSVMISATET